MLRVITTLLAITLLQSCKDSTQTTNQPLVVGYQNSPVAALLMIAESKGFFDSVGLKVKMQSYTAGKFAVADLTSGKGVEVALSGDLPIVYTRLQGFPTKIIAQVVRSTVNECRIIAWKDGNLLTAEQYFKKPRQVATSKKGTPEYFLHVFMEKYQLDTTTVKIVGMKPDDMPAELINKGVDAICIFDPAASFATREMGNDGIVIEDSSLYSALYVVSVLDKTLHSRSDDLIKFLKALNKAVSFCETNTEESKKIVATYTSLEKDIIDSLWARFRFDIAFTSRLAQYLNDEAIWAKNSGDTSFTSPIPNFIRDVIDTSLLHAVAPSKINLNE